MKQILCQNYHQDIIGESIMVRNYKKLTKWQRNNSRFPNPCRDYLMSVHIVCYERIEYNIYILKTFYYYGEN